MRVYSVNLLKNNCTKKPNVGQKKNTEDIVLRILRNLLNQNLLKILLKKGIFVNVQYKYRDGYMYIVCAHARSRKRLNPTLFPRLSHAKSALNPCSVHAWISCSVKTITLVLASTLIQAHPYASSGKKIFRVI